MEIVEQIEQICNETGNGWLLEKDFTKIALSDLKLREYLDNDWKREDKTDKEMFEVIEDLQAFNSENDLTILNTTLSRKLEEFAHAKILDGIEDWWNNDGGYGTLCILVPSGKYLIKNNIRYSEFHEYIHESDLIKESIE